MRRDRPCAAPGLGEMSEILWSKFRNFGCARDTPANLSDRPWCIRRRRRISSRSRARSDHRPTDARSPVAIFSGRKLHTEVDRFRSTASVRGASSGKAGCEVYAEQSAPRRGIFRIARHHQCRIVRQSHWPASRAICNDPLAAKSQKDYGSADFQRCPGRKDGSDNRGSVVPPHTCGTNSWRRYSVAKIFRYESHFITFSFARKLELLIANHISNRPLALADKPQCLTSAEDSGMGAATCWSVFSEGAKVISHSHLSGFAGSSVMACEVSIRRSGIAPRVPRPNAESPVART